MSTTTIATAGTQITIIGTGAIRATIPGGQIARRFVKVGQRIYGKRDASDRITGEHALLTMSGGAAHPFVARDEETCAQALARYFVERETQNCGNGVWDIDHMLND